MRGIRGCIVAAVAVAPKQAEHGRRKVVDLSINNEFSRPLRIDRLPETGKDINFTATSIECDAVAKRLELIAVEALSASGRLEPSLDRKLVKLHAVVVARCTQQCVATMKPVPTDINQPIERCFYLGEQSALSEIVVNERDDEPEPINDPLLDLGEIVVEEFSLAVDAYPRAPDVPAPAFEARGRGFRQPFQPICSPWVTPQRLQSLSDQDGELILSCSKAPSKRLRLQSSIRCFDAKMTMEMATS